MRLLILSEQTLSLNDYLSAIHSIVFIISTTFIIVMNFKLLLSKKNAPKLKLFQYVSDMLFNQETGYFCVVEDILVSHKQKDINGSSNNSDNNGNNIEPSIVHLLNEKFNHINTRYLTTVKQVDERMYKEIYLDFEKINDMLIIEVSLNGIDSSITQLHAKHAELLSKTLLYEIKLI